MLLLQAKLETPELSVTEIVSRLVQRRMDLESAVKKHIEDYKEHLLTKIEVCAES